MTPWRATGAAFYLVAAICLAGCSANFVAPANVEVTSRSAPLPAAVPPDVEDDSAIVVAFSGGGSRAAAFAHGVMLGLDRIPAGRGRTYFDRVISYSGVSGGSVTAAYYGLRGRAALADFRERFLLRNAEEDLETNVNLANLSTGLHGGVNDATRFSRWLDRNLFNGAPLSDILRPGRPIVWINASDLYNRTPFLFSPLTFAALCSDPKQYPLSLAVAASAAVPVAFVPIVLANYPAACQTPLPPWVDRVLQSPSAGAQAKAFALALKRYRDPDAMRYIKLADGGLTDNFGLSGLVIARAEEQRPYAPLSARSVVRLSRVNFIVVNAGSESAASWAQTVEGPSGAEMIKAISDTAIDSAVRSGFDAFRLSVREWEAAARKWRCSLSQAEARRFGAAADWRCSNIKFEITEVAFNQLDPAWAAQLSAIPTRFHLPPESVDSLINAGAVLVSRQLKR